MIDSSDTARLGEARSELHKIINDREMKDALLLVFANKQDVEGRMLHLLFGLVRYKPLMVNYLQISARRK